MLPFLRYTTSSSLVSVVVSVVSSVVSVVSSVSGVSSVSLFWAWHRLPVRIRRRRIFMVVFSIFLVFVGSVGCFAFSVLVLSHTAVWLYFFLFDFDFFLIGGFDTPLISLRSIVPSF